MFFYMFAAEMTELHETIESKIERLISAGNFRDYVKKQRLPVETLDGNITDDDLRKKIAEWQSKYNEEKRIIAEGIMDVMGEEGREG